MDMIMTRDCGPLKAVRIALVDMSGVGNLLTMRKGVDVDHQTKYQKFVIFPAYLFISSVFPFSRAHSYCKGTPNPFPFFPTTPSLSVHSGTLPEFLVSRPEYPEPPETVRSFRNPRRPSGVSELHPIPFGLASPHFEAHHCTVPSHADSVYVFSCIPSKVSLEYSLWILPC